MPRTHAGLLPPRGVHPVSHSQIGCGPRAASRRYGTAIRSRNEVHRDHGCVVPQL